MCSSLKNVSWLWIALFYLSVSSVNAFGRKDLDQKLQQMRPSDLIVLLKKQVLGGSYLLGIYEVQVDDVVPDLRRFKIWKEQDQDLSIHSESVRCSLEEPLRVKRTTSMIYLRRLNPGGVVNSLNREDYLVWWAACYPDLAGIDPGTLKTEALELGFSTRLPELQEVLRSP